MINYLNPVRGLFIISQISSDFTGQDFQSSALTDAVLPNQTRDQPHLWSWKPVQFEHILPKSVRTILLQFTRQVNDAYSVKRTFPNTDTTSRAEPLVDRRLRLILLNFDGINPTPHNGTILDTEDAAILRLTAFLV